MDTRKELKYKFKEKFKNLFNQEIDIIVDLILEDRKKMVEPLVRWKEEMNIIDKWPDSSIAIEKTLKNAGVQP